MKNKRILEKLTEDMELRNFAETTKESYRAKARDVLKYFEMRGKEFEEVTIEEIRKYLLEYLKKEKQLDERSVNYYNSVIRFIYGVTVDEIINLKQIPMLKKKKKLMKVLDKEELSAFFDACEKPIYRLIFMMIYGSGLRISEALNLRISDIDSRTMRIFVREGKGRKERYTILPKATLDGLREYWRREKPNHKEGYIFLNREGNPLKVERTRVYFRRYRRKANINDEFVVHTLRHSFATDMIERGATIIEVKELLGHSNIRSTMEYIHVANIEPSIENPLDVFLKNQKMIERSSI